ncbi:MAG: hypothetical protein ACPL28_02580 [bacterium]
MKGLTRRGEEGRIRVKRGEEGMGKNKADRPERPNRPDKDAINGES